MFFHKSEKKEKRFLSESRRITCTSNSRSILMINLKKKKTYYYGCYVRFTFKSCVLFVCVYQSLIGSSVVKIRIFRAVRERNNKRNVRAVNLLFAFL